MTSPWTDLLVWAAVVLAALLADGVALGCMRAWASVRGGGRLVRARVPIAGGTAAAALALAAALLAPTARAQVPYWWALVPAAAAVPALAVAPKLRPLAHAAAAVTMCAAAGGSLVLALQGFGAPLPDLAATWAGAALAATGLPTSRIAGRYVPRALVSPRRAVGLVVAGARIAQAQALERERRAVKLAAYIALAGLPCSVVLLLAGASRGPGWRLTLLLVTVCSVGPLVLLIAVRATRSWIAFCTRPVAWTYYVLFGFTYRASSAVRRTVIPAMVLHRYPRALCDTCLRWSRPLDSRYVAGRRRCEKCGGLISFAGGPGRLVALIGEQTVPDDLPARVFVRRGADLVAVAAPVDVTDIRLDFGDGRSEEFESLTSFLLNELPEDGLEQVRVFALHGRDVLPASARNLVDNLMRWSAADPLRADG